MKSIRAIAFFAIFSSHLSTTVWADVKPAAFFSDHAILQRSPATAVWGWADPGENVSVSLDKTSVTATTDAEGKWQTTLDLSQMEVGPHEMRIEGKNRLVFRDILVGEVWICSGQSNMQMQLKYALDSAAEIARSENPQLRQFSVQTKSSVDPLEKLEGKWFAAGPETSGAFSAVGYFFGKTLQQRLKTPVALIYAAVPGTAVECWTSAEALDRSPTSKAEKDKLVGEVRTLPDRLAEYRRAFSAWSTKYKRGYTAPQEPARFHTPGTADLNWTPVRLPGKIARDGHSGSGFVWLRKVIKIPESSVGKKLRLVWDERNPVFGDVYWNGQPIDEMTPDSLRRVVPWEPRGVTVVPAGLVKAGNNTVAIRVYAPAGDSEFLFDEKKNPLMAGEWEAQWENEFPIASEEMKASYPGLPPFKTWDDSVVPTLFYNGMIHPMLPLTVRGVAWYQGEGNVHRAAAYKEGFSTLIDDWRENFGQELPFYFCQLPNAAQKATQPGESKWAELRQSQLLILSKPKTGMAVLIDGRDPQLHPRDKENAGVRLAKNCLANTYQIPEPSSGPLYQSMKIEAGKVRLAFTSDGGALVAAPLGNLITRYEGDKPVTEAVQAILPESELQGFAICGTDRKWEWANATIEGNSVLVHSPKVASPVAVRYAWADNPTCNLFDEAGLPASPFRTDDFPLLTKDR